LNDSNDAVHINEILIRLNSALFQNPVYHTILSKV